MASSTKVLPILDKMPDGYGKLNDIVNKLDDTTKSSIVINLDACLPSNNNELSLAVLNTILTKISVNENPIKTKTLSLRFNNLSSSDLCEVLYTWLATNETLEILYLMSTGIDEKNRVKIEEAWKKKLAGHYTENMGYTFIRCGPDNEDDVPNVNDEED